ELKLDTMFFVAGLGFLLMDAMCVFRMASAGVFDRWPTVRFMFCQLCGVAPFCCSRWDFHAAQTKMIQKDGALLPTWATTSLSDVLSRVWMETHTQDRHALKLVIDECGDHTIVLGGDYPFT